MTWNPGKNFLIEYRDNLLASWTTVATYVSNTVSSKNADFQRDDYSKSKYSKTATLLKTNYTFPIAPTAQFRVRCNGSDDNDQIYIDLITITGTIFNTSNDWSGRCNLQFRSLVKSR